MRNPLFASIEHLAWDSQFFDKKIGRLAIGGDSVFSDTQCADYQLLQARIASSDTATLDALGQWGFRLVESEVDLALTLQTTERQAEVKIARQSDIEALRLLAAEAFHDSRFRAPWFSLQQNQAFYARWIENAVLGTFDDQCLVIKDVQGRIQGFVSLREIDETSARIGLLAVAPHAQGQGIGQRLFAAAADWARVRRRQQLYVATQLSNVRALRLYTRCGAQIQTTSYWLYR